MTTKPTLLLLACLFQTCPCVTAGAASLDELRNLKASDRWAVRVGDEPITVYTTLKPADCEHGTNQIRRMSFCSLDLPRAGDNLQIEIEAQGAERIEIRPQSSPSAQRLQGDAISLQLDQPQHLLLLANGSWEDALVLSIHPPELASSEQQKLADHYFGPGIHQIGERYRLQSGETAYLARGAIVIGSFWIQEAKDVQILGRGILYGGDDTHREDYQVIGGSSAQGALIQGITIANAPGWIVSFWDDSKNLTVRDVTMVGNYRYNTDGVQTGAEGLLVEDCFLQTNDDNFSLNGPCRKVLIQNNVLWNLYNGGVFMLGWGDGPGFQLQNIQIKDCVVVRAGGCCPHHRKAPFSLMMAGRGGSVRDVLFQRITVEELLPVANWIDLQATEATDARVENVHLEHISIDALWSVAGEIRGPAAGSPIREVLFSDLKIAGRKVRSAAEAGLTIENARQIQFRVGRSKARRRRLFHNNLLSAPMLQGAATAWVAYNEGSCRVFLQAAESPRRGRVFRVTERTSPLTGLRQDVTDSLRESGSGDYALGAVVRGLEGEVPLRVDLKIEDRDGVRYLSSEPILARPDQWDEVRTTHSLNWIDLQTAEWIIQSADDSTGDFLLAAGVLERVP